MMNNRTIIIGGCAAALSVFSLGAQAATRTDGLNACAEAVVATLETAQSEQVDYSIGADSSKSNLMLRRLEVFHLDVTRPGTEEIIARADCTVDRKANVRSLKSVPIDGEDAIVRARQNHF